MNVSRMILDYDNYINDSVIYMTKIVQSILIWTKILHRSVLLMTYGIKGSSENYLCDF